MSTFLCKLFHQGSLTNAVTVSVPGANGTDSENVNVPIEWHLCGDLKFVLEVCGFKGCNANKPCYLCMWDRRKGTQAAPFRTKQETDCAIQLADLIPDLKQAVTDADLIRKSLNSARSKGCSNDLVAGLEKQLAERMQIQDKCVEVKTALE